jgi:hypothetical protein
LINDPEATSESATRTALASIIDDQSLQALMRKAPKFEIKFK